VVETMRRSLDRIGGECMYANWVYKGSQPGD
jgi:hypothetical protein